MKGGRLLNKSGRVLGITGLGTNLNEAREKPIKRLNKFTLKVLTTGEILRLISKKSPGNLCNESCYFSQWRGIKC